MIALEEMHQMGRMCPLTNTYWTADRIVYLRFIGSIGGYQPLSVMLPRIYVRVLAISTNFKPIITRVLSLLPDAACHFSFRYIDRGNASPVFKTEIQHELTLPPEPQRLFLSIFRAISSLQPFKLRTTRFTSTNLISFPRFVTSK